MHVVWGLGLGLGLHVVWGLGLGRVRVVVL